ncbi:MAG: hypothetical protein RL235_756 [Chlamydiota bacterium]
MSETSDFDIRYSESQDLEPLLQWFSDPTSADAYPFDYEEREWSLKNWIGFAKFKASLTATVNNVPCAIGTLFLMPYRKVAHHCGFFLIVDPAFRRRGIGTSMMRNLEHLAKTKFRLESLHADLYEPSLLLPILLKLGYEVLAKQEDFVVINGVGCARILVEHRFV